MGVGIVKEVGFKPEIKERWSYICTEWWIRTGTRMKLTNRKRELTRGHARAALHIARRFRAMICLAFRCERGFSW